MGWISVERRWNESRTTRVAGTRLAGGVPLWLAAVGLLGGCLADESTLSLDEILPSSVVRLDDEADGAFSASLGPSSLDVLCQSVADSYELDYDPRAEPSLSVLGDGEPVECVGFGELERLWAVSWELFVDDGPMELVLGEEGSLVVDDVELTVDLCEDLVEKLVECDGDLECWRGEASVPEGAPRLGCRPAGDVES